MNQVFIIETPRRAAGLAIAERGGYRFHAAQSDLFHLDNRVFASVAALHRAVIANDNASPAPATKQRGRGPRRGT